MPRSSSSLRVPASTGSPSTVASTPWPVSDWKADALGASMPRSRAPATIAAASGCSERDSAAAARRSSFVLVEARGRDRIGELRARRG